ncbi:MAG: CARDB domain-containing protein [Pirellulales bacterium]
MSRFDERNPRRRGFEALELRSMMASDCLWCIDFRQMAATAAANRAAASTAVYSYSGTIAGTSSISTGNAAALVDDGYENNDTRATAYDLGTIAGSKQISGVMADSADWFKFTIGSTGTSSSKVSLAFTHSQGDLDIAIYNANGTRVGLSQGVTNSESLSLNGLAAGTYTVQVYGYRGVTNPAYALTINHGTTTTPPTASADLLGAGMNAPDSAYWGQSITVTGNVRNSGTAAAGASTVEWYLSQDSTYSTNDIRLTTTSGATASAVVALGVNATTQVTETLALPASLPSGLSGGNFYLVMRTDASNAIVESNEGNNGGQLGAGIDNEAITITTAPTTPPPTTPGTSQFTIALQITGMTASQSAIFQAAAARWSQIILGDLPNATYNGVAVDDLLINASAVSIDGVGGVLGQAGPDRFRSGSSLPYHGTMQFDSADLASMEANGSLYSVILHEMGHVLGLGTLWSSKGLLVGAGTSNPVYVGANAVAQYNSYTGGNATSIPVENTGGSGTRDSHCTKVRSVRKS